MTKWTVRISSRLYLAVVLPPNTELTRTFSLLFGNKTFGTLAVSEWLTRANTSTRFYELVNNSIPFPIFMRSSAIAVLTFDFIPTPTTHQPPNVHFFQDKIKNIPVIKKSRSLDPILTLHMKLSQIFRSGLCSRGWLDFSIYTSLGITKWSFIDGFSLINLKIDSCWSWVDLWRGSNLFLFTNILSQINFPIFDKNYIKLRKISLDPMAQCPS